MDRRLAEYIVEVSCACDYDSEAHVREDYSGRGMYGKTTSGVVISDSTIVATIFFENAEEISELQEEGNLPHSIGRLNTDGMGRSFIIY